MQMRIQQIKKTEHLASLFYRTDEPFGFTIHFRSLTKMTGKYCIYKHSK